MNFHIITIFPDIFKSYFSESIIWRAQNIKKIKINVLNLRNFTKDKHRKVDDRTYGGGAGMIIQVEPIFRAVESIKKKLKNKKVKVIVFGARGKKFNQKMAQEFSKINDLILICGRYEGVDERIIKNIADAEISIGDYVLTGGEIPAMTILDSVTRLIPGVIKERSLKEESFSDNSLEYPQYTRPEIFTSKKGIDWKVPKILLSGNHAKIAEWRKKYSKIIKK